jgi:glycerophosphoryl diester phosphodiesterase
LAKVEPSKLDRIYAEFQQPAGTKVLVAAHRGLSGRSTGAWQKYPENSLAAIANSIELGIDIVEVDVRKTKDGQLILMHDANVDRTTDGTGGITNLTLAEIKQLHLRLGVGGTNAAVSDQRVPTLEEVMLLAKDKCMVNLDKAWIIVPECCAVLKKTGTLHQAIFKSSYSAARCEVDFADLNPPVYFMPIILRKKGWETLILA